MPDVDEAVRKLHRDRAERLREFYGEWSKVNDDSLDEAEVILPDDEDDDPTVPHRFVLGQWDGSSSWFMFSDTLDEAVAYAEGEIGGEVPWAPGDILDLDTGARYATYVKVTAKRYTHRASWWYELYGRRQEVSGLFPSEEAAQEYVKTIRESNEDARDITIEEAPA